MTFSVFCDRGVCGAVRSFRCPVRSKFLRAAACACALLLSLVHTEDAVAAADVIRLEQEVSIDPYSGSIQGRATVLVAAEQGAFSQVGLVLDRGLTVSHVAADSGAVSFQQTIYQQYRYAQLVLSPPVTGSVVLTIEFGGVAECPRVGATSACDLGAQQRIARFMTGSIFPWFVTQNGPDILEHDVTLHTPAGMPLVVSAEPVMQSEAGGVRTSRWKIDRPVPNGLDVYLGDLESTPVPGLSGAIVTVNHQRSDDAWTAPLLQWVPDIVAFHELRMQAPLPFAHVSLLKLPSYLGTFGHTSPAHICLSDWHGSGPAATFEEMWAHEFAHLWWGVSVVPVDFDRQKLITEGFAVLAQQDYSAARLTTAEARDAYLARRNREAELLMRYVVVPGTIPAPVATTAAQVPPRSDAKAWWTWAYANTAAVLDFIRVQVGDEVFLSAQRAFAVSCSHARCGISDFEDALDTASSRDVAPLFARWVHDGRPAELRIGFDESSLDDGRIALTIRLKQRGVGPTPMTLVVELRDGRMQRFPVSPATEEASYTLVVDGPVRAVRPELRQLPLLWAESMIEGDVDFDGEVDGRDVLHCARLEGKQVSVTWVIGDSALGVDLDFEPRCDLVRDGKLDASDLETLSALFPRVKDR